MLFNTAPLGILWQSSGYYSELLLQGAWVWSLVRELRFHMPCTAPPPKYCSLMCYRGGNLYSLLWIYKNRRNVPIPGSSESFLEKNVVLYKCIFNIFKPVCETYEQRMLGAGTLGSPRGMVWGERWEGASGLGTHVHPLQIHVDVWRNQYSIFK